MQGLFLCNKPSGPSSAQFINQIKHIFQLSRATRIGHGGTLDPFASGLLVVGVSRAYTKLLDHQLHHVTKKYKAQIVLGATSNTDDRMGEIKFSSHRLKITDEEIRKSIEQLQHQEEQVPPQYSAIKIKGKPAYERSRAGETLVISPKKVKLFEYTIDSIKEKDELLFLSVIILVSSGFYVRSFARDLGNLLGVGGYVDALERLEIGHFSLKNALNLDDLAKNVELHFLAHGVVQNVGFRGFAQSVAQRLGITGFAQNIEGDVYIKGQGTLTQLQEFLSKISVGPEGSHIESKEDWFGCVLEVYKDFSIL